MGFKYFLASVVLGGLIFSYKSVENLSNTPGCSSTSAGIQRSVAVDANNRVHVVWVDEVDTTSTKILHNFKSDGFLVKGDTKFKSKQSSLKLFYRRSTNGGGTFGDTVRLDDSLATQPAIATNDENMVHIFYSKTDDYDSSYIHYKHSINGGNSWIDTILSSAGDDAPIGWAVVAASGANNVHTFWRQAETFYSFIYTHSSNGGAAWTPVQRLVDSLDDVYIPALDASALPVPSVAASGNVVHLVWQSPVDDSMAEVYYKRSADNGDNWSTNERLTNDTAYSLWPCVASSGNSVYVGWLECEAGDSLFAYYIRHSSDGGLNWDAPVCLVPKEDSLDAMFNEPQVAVRGNYVAVVYGAYVYDTLMLSSCPKACLKYSDNNGASWSSTVVSGDTMYTIYPSVVIDNAGYAHVVWSGVGVNMSNPDVYYSKVQLTAVEERDIGSLNTKPTIGVYPNVASRFANINYELPARSIVSLKIYDVSGSLVETVFEGERYAGKHSVEVDTKNLAAGIYFVKLNAGSYATGKRLVIVR